MMADMTDKEIVDKIVADHNARERRNQAYIEKKRAWLERREHLVDEVRKQIVITKIDAEFLVDKMIEGTFPEW